MGGGGRQKQWRISFPILWKECSRIEPATVTMGWPIIAWFIFFSIFLCDRDYAELGSLAAVNKNQKAMQMKLIFNILQYTGLLELNVIPTWWTPWRPRIHQYLFMFHVLNRSIKFVLMRPIQVFSMFVFMRNTYKRQGNIYHHLNATPIYSFDTLDKHRINR